MNFFIFTLLILLFVQNGHSAVMVLTKDNFKNVIKEYDFVLINFYADWCHFSRLLAPIYADASDAIEDLVQTKKALLAKVDCENQKDVAAENSIRKYPTIKMYKHGEVLKSEYRGQRTKEAFANFVREQLKEAFTILDAKGDASLAKLNEKNNERNFIVAMFQSMPNASTHFAAFRKVADIMSQNCRFYAFGNVPGDEQIYYLPDHGSEKVIYPELSAGGPPLNFDNFSVWSRQQCVPVVRELTFAVAEEITEEGLPLLLLFHRPDDKDTPAKFRAFARKQLMDLTKTVNMVTADGQLFAHPLMHLGKKLTDLPVFCIDSFAHMYVYSKDVQLALTDEKYLRQFIEDLKSGKLHREFHNGPDPTPTLAQPQIGNDNDGSEQVSPPVSVFRKLGPSSNRYTILHDEF